MNDELPAGWEWSTIGQVADVQLGRQRSPQHHQGAQMRSYLRSANVTWDGISLDDVKEMNFDDTDFEKYRLAAGDLLLNEASGSPNEVGKPAIWNGELEDCCFQNTLLRLRPHDVDRSYLYWYCFYAALSGRFGEAGRGVNIRHLGKRGLVGFPIPVAPRPMQAEIAERVAEVWSDIDAASASLEGARRRLDALTASTLDSVCSGPWPQRPLSELVLSLRNGVFVSRPGVDPPGHPIYRISAVRPLVLRTDDIRYADPIPDKAESYVVEAGDLLFTRYSGNPDFVGAAAVVPPAGAGVLHPDKLIRVVVDRTKVLPEWVAAYVAGGAGRREIETRLKTTAGQVGISGTQLRSVPIAVPPIDYQRAALLRLEMVLDERDRLKKAVHAADVHATSLRRSVLAAAFRGRLTSKELAA